MPAKISVVGSLYLREQTGTYYARFLFIAFHAERENLKGKGVPHHSSCQHIDKAVLSSCSVGEVAKFA